MTTFYEIHKLSLASGVKFLNFDNHTLNPKKKKKKAAKTHDVSQRTKDAYMP